MLLLLWAPKSDVRCGAGPKDCFASASCERTDSSQVFAPRFDTLLISRHTPSKQEDESRHDTATGTVVKVV